MRRRYESFERKRILQWIFRRIKEASVKTQETRRLRSPRKSKNFLKKMTSFMFMILSHLLQSVILSIHFLCFFNLKSHTLRFIYFLDSSHNKSLRNFLHIGIEIIIVSNIFLVYHLLYLHLLKWIYSCIPCDL